MNGTKILIACFALSLLVSCKSYVQVFETSSENVEVKGDVYVYETDTLRITYSFWEEKGVLSFSVYNKLEKPIYLDWKKSSFIDHHNKLNYWVDEEFGESISNYGGYVYNGPLIRPGTAVFAGSSTTNTTKVKPERITFIPPRSNFYKSQFYLLPQTYYKLDVNTPVVETERNDKPHRTTKVYTATYPRNNSPLLFRNFLAFSLTEQFEEVFYVDNEFYISKIMEMDYRHFGYNKKGDDGRYRYTFPFEKGTSFYLYVPKKKGVADRK